ncbi:MAG: leucine-rich repeat domain-containing protein [Clostridiales bacterium]|jgi:hypothetical protein|nr:leucine-rich repeat domain-containing protein [Clostridiales bacterium]
MKDRTAGYEFMITDTGILKGFRRHPDSLAPADTVFLPDEIEEIGQDAMQRFSCTHLVMPRALKTIKSGAFVYAAIEDIDFNHCNLLSIYSNAFRGCRAKTALPDSIESLGEAAVRTLDLAKGVKLRLPSSLRHIGWHAANLNGIHVLEVDERMIARNSGLEKLIISTDGGRLILYVRRDEKLVCRVPFPMINGYSNPNYFCEKGFNYSAYDECFEAATGRYLKSAIAAFRVMFHEGLTLEEIKAFKNYATANLTFLIKGFEDDIETIKLYDEAGFITAYRLKQLLENARIRNNVEAAAAILELLNRRSGAKTKSLRL